MQNLNTTVVFPTKCGRATFDCLAINLYVRPGVGNNIYVYTSS